VTGAVRASARQAKDNMTRFVLRLFAPATGSLHVTTDKWFSFTSQGLLNDQETFIDIIVAIYVGDTR